MPLGSFCLWKNLTKKKEFTAFYDIWKLFHFLKVLTVSFSFQGNFPFRLNAIHLLNPSWHFKLLWKMTNVPSLIKPKLAEHLYIHEGDLTKFYEEFPRRYLPPELGGTTPYDNKVWTDELLEPEQTEQDTQMQTSAHLQALCTRNGYQYFN